MDGVGVVGPGAGVDNQACGVCRLPDPTDELPLVFGLAGPELDFGEPAAQELLYVPKYLRVVEVWGALA